MSSFVGILFASFVSSDSSIGILSAFTTPPSFSVCIFSAGVGLFGAILPILAVSKSTLPINFVSLVLVAVNNFSMVLVVVPVDLAVEDSLAVFLPSSNFLAILFNTLTWAELPDLMAVLIDFKAALTSVTSLLRLSAGGFFFDLGGAKSPSASSKTGGLGFARDFRGALVFGGLLYSSAS